MPNLARIKAAEILREVEKGEKELSDLLNRAEKEINDPRDRGLMRALVYGSLENLLHIDQMIDVHSKRPISAQKPIVRAILRMSVFELFFLKTPAHAAINEAVELTKKKAAFARGYVNGLLRSMNRQGEDLLDYKSNDPIEELSILSSHPRWIIELLLENYSLDELKEILKLNNQPSPVNIFVCPPLSPKEGKEILQKEGIEGLRESEIESHSLISSGGALTETKLFRRGKITILSQPSAFTGAMAVEGLGSDAKILDLCAAPGSKTSVMSVLSGAEIVANDKSQTKLDRLRENIERLNLSSIKLTESDASQKNPSWFEAFDLVILDAPCSGLGLMGRKPDIRYNRKIKDIKELQRLQKKLLKNAQEYVRPGGRLVYSTCTYGKAENEEVIKTLAPNFKKEPVTKGPFKGQSILHFSPLMEGADGFFFSRFRKA